LDDIHDAGYLHGDIRSPNLTLKEDGTVSIIDFDNGRRFVKKESREEERGQLLDVLDDYQKEATRAVEEATGGRGKLRGGRAVLAVPPRRSARIAKQSVPNHLRRNLIVLFGP
jgi:serine/threonine protein kinase